MYAVCSYCSRFFAVSKRKTYVSVFYLRKVDCDCDEI